MNLEKIFSVKNEYNNDKVHKVICFLGLKFSLRNKKKEQHYTLENVPDILQRLGNKINHLKNVLDLSIDICSIPPAKGNLKLVQDCSVAILNYFSKICKKHNINYWIDSGTLIGYLRHNGFIPWDDDIDICMMREDYEKILKLNNKFLIKNHKDGIHV